MADVQFPEIIRPQDKLVLVLPAGTPLDQAENLRSWVRERGFSDEQVFIVGGVEAFIVRGDGD